MNNFFKWIFVISFSLALISWGGTGHRIISGNASYSFNQEMQQFQTWSSYLADHASDADYRKSSDPTESPKHYIDIDYYPEFLNAGYIPQTLSEAITVHGYNNVYNWGILPWATKTAYDSLKSNLQKNNWERAKLFAADLGHYVADGHMPLHITKNYNGQLTDNDGIHSRYESTMVNAHAADFVYSGKEINQIQNVNQYILNYIYHNYQYLDSVINADNYAKSINSNYYSDAYKNALWEKTGSFTIELFKNASHALSELIYTAWKEAGSPSITGINLTDGINHDIILEPVSPNPVTDKATISFNLKSPAVISLTMHDINGKLIATLASGKFSEGEYSLNWIPNNEKKGLYFIALNTSKSRHTQKFIVK
ncbi:MAG: T9SS type A sorting domain-containing protein [Bacteroidales bacterium]|nr:MAG: T9SS type A sorting domain-containing protein [Bacteroidales bacterium]